MMKNLLLLLAIIATSSAAKGQCRDVPLSGSTGKTLIERKIVNRSQTASEYLLTVRAAVAGASWQKKGAEAAVLTVFVDGRYYQDMILFAGEKTFEYRALLGQLEPGEHILRLVRNERRSAPGAGQVKITELTIEPLENTFGRGSKGDAALERLAAINAPMIGLRPDTIDKFSDIPLLTYYEIFYETDKTLIVRYTTVFTNEDGGTASRALLARWGRLTDIEWIYEIRVDPAGKILSENYQAANHVTKDFKGKRFGSHPVLFDATVNNNFADEGCSPLRVSPVLTRARLDDGSRETVMDAFSWTYRIMAEEAFREGRIASENLGANRVADPRDYFYLEIQSEPQRAAVSAEIESAGETARSDYADARLRVDRPGFVRIAVPRPAGLKTDFPASVGVVCSEIAGAAKGLCAKTRLVKIVRLDRFFYPREKTLKGAESRDIEAGSKAVFKIE